MAIALAVTLAVMVCVVGGRVLFAWIFTVPVVAAVPLMGPGQSRKTGGLLAITAGGVVLGYLAMVVAATLNATGEGAPTGRSLHVVSEVSPLGPAYKKIHPGDVIHSVNGKAIYASENLSERVNTIGERSISFAVERDGKRKTIRLKPMKEKDDVLRVGVNLVAKTEIVKAPLGAAVKRGLWLPLAAVGAESKSMVMAATGKAAFSFPISDRLSGASAREKVRGGIIMAVWLWLMLLVVDVGALVAWRVSSPPGRSQGW